MRQLQRLAIIAATIISSLVIIVLIFGFGLDFSTGPPVYAAETTDAVAQLPDPSGLAIVGTSDIPDDNVALSKADTGAQASDVHSLDTIGIGSINRFVEGGGDTTVIHRSDDTSTALLPATQEVTTIGSTMNLLATGAVALSVSAAALFVTLWTRRSSSSRRPTETRRLVQHSFVAPQGVT